MPPYAPSLAPAEHYRYNDHTQLYSYPTPAIP